jgi:hypothetical protein
MDVPDHTSCRALTLQSLSDLFAGPPPPYYLDSLPFSLSVGVRKIMIHFVVNTFFRIRSLLQHSAPWHSRFISIPPPAV